MLEATSAALADLASAYWEAHLESHPVEATSLGDRRYDGVLSAGERTLRDRLLALVDNAGADERATGAWAEVERMLRRLGIR